MVGWIDRQTDGRTNGQTDGWMDRRTNRWTDGQTDRESERERESATDAIRHHRFKRGFVLNILSFYLRSVTE
jgi:hypothetical protein